MLSKWSFAQFGARHIFLGLFDVFFLLTPLFHVRLMAKVLTQSLGQLEFWTSAPLATLSAPPAFPSVQDGNVLVVRVPEQEDADEDEEGLPACPPARARGPGKSDDAHFASLLAVNVLCLREGFRKRYQGIFRHFLTWTKTEQGGNFPLQGRVAVC